MAIYCTLLNMMNNAASFKHFECHARVLFTSSYMSTQGKVAVSQPYWFFFLIVENKAGKKSCFPAVFQPELVVPVLTWSHKQQPVRLSVFQSLLKGNQRAINRVLTPDKW